MTIGFSLALTLGAGLHADSGPTILKQRCALAWGKIEVFVAHQVEWDLTRVKAWQQQTGWSIQYAGNFEWPYRLRLEGTRQFSYGDMHQHRLQARWGYGDARQHKIQAHWTYGEKPVNKVRHRISYSGLNEHRKSIRLPYWITEAVVARHQLDYTITDVNPAQSRLTVGWSLLDDLRFQAVVNTPELVWNGRTIRILQATLSCDEDSPVWMVQIEIAELPDFATMAITDSLTLTLGLETFALVIDGKTLTRQENAEQHYQITAVSPLALLDAPFSGTTRFYHAEAISASVAIEILIGPIDWQLPDWTIPAGRLLLDGVTPLAGARTIVAAIGGLVESRPDGSVVCRRRHPVSVPDYDTATVPHSLFDSEVISSRAQIAPANGFDRVTIANEESGGSSASDRIEFVVNAEDSHQGLVRAYLGTIRTVLLTHTGHPDTVIMELGPTVRTETETVEFIDGRASSKCPVTTITSALWQHSDLGMVAANQQSLSVDNAGYSLLKLTYTTTSLNWKVSLITDEEVQFVLVDV
ncbi:MAG: hypothetical protein CTY19_05850 [Methylomonas sp.]|nr:MAG: hypothetical protein CTY19_05850 [Methylomonas sp.]